MASRAGWHASLHDLVYDYVQRAVPDAKALQDRLLAAYQAKCKDGWPSGPNDGYFFSHLRQHLIAAGRGPELADLLQQVAWLEAKCEVGLPFDLTVDFSKVLEVLPFDDCRRKLLGLLDEAIRDLPFIARHPSTLFQCLWNSCWWYDSPEAAHITRPRPAVGQMKAPPWSSTAANRLSTLLERWREEKEGTEARLLLDKVFASPSVRARRPAVGVPPSGDGSILSSVDWSPDGSLIAGGSRDGSVWVWNTTTGVMMSHPFAGTNTKTLSFAWPGRPTVN